ncbi:MAG: tryptophan synthase subunit alpha [Sandaracinaceae bacterium]|nr:tryptophan synthase subunit alpha [Sandaracinaceae bacterium]
MSQAKPEFEPISVWNAARNLTRPKLHDETLRDGLQNPTALDPSVEQKIEIVHLLDTIGIDSVNIGLPAAGPRPYADCVAIAKAMAASGLRITAAGAARTMVADIGPMADVTQKTGVPMEVMTFIGSSPIRQYVEEWSVKTIRERSVEAIAFAAKEGLPVTYVTEDTTRTPPHVLYELFTAAIEAGAGRLCLCDTVGHATPDGARNLVEFTRNLIDGLGAEVGVDWHGHDDRGFALANALAAMDAGADRIHGCVLGVGERVGNTSLEHLLRNLERDGRYGTWNTTVLGELCAKVYAGTKFPPRPDHPYLDARA